MARGQTVRKYKVVCDIKKHEMVGLPVNVSLKECRDFIRALSVIYPTAAEDAKVISEPAATDEYIDIREVKAVATWTRA